MPAADKAPAEAPAKAPEVDTRDEEILRLQRELSGCKAELKTVLDRLALTEKNLEEEMSLRESQRDEHEAALEALRELREQIRLRPLAPNAKEGAPIFFALCEISNSGRPIMPGDVLPFDPYNPPKGYDGFVEGTHFRRG